MTVFCTAVNLRNLKKNKKKKKKKRRRRRKKKKKKKKIDWMFLRKRERNVWGYENWPWRNSENYTHITPVIVVSLIQAQNRRTTKLYFISLDAFIWFTSQVTHNFLIIIGQQDNNINIQQFYVLPTQCIYVFCVDLRTNSDYFPIQH